VGFTLFFLAEYTNMLLMSLYFVLLFLGGWFPPFTMLFNEIFTPFMVFYNIFLHSFGSFKTHEFILFFLYFTCFIPLTVLWLYYTTTAHNLRDALESEIKTDDVHYITKHVEVDRLVAIELSKASVRGLLTLYFTSLLKVSRVLLYLILVTGIIYILHLLEYHIFNLSIFYLAAKTTIIVFLFIWTRATLPRFRYDQLMW
jgi:NADH:ubiquinone oxidoreductase subunit H